MTYGEVSKSVISNFRILLPPLNIQNKMIIEINKLEKTINESKSFLNESYDLKKQILKKHLE